MNKTFKIHMSGELPFTADNLALIQRLEDAMSHQLQYLYSDQSDCMKKFVYLDKPVVHIDVHEKYNTPEKEGDMVFDNISDAIAYRDQWDLDNPYKAPKKVEAA